ncbi:MAG: acireductone synthase [Bacteriovoracaceae bacterium]
MIKYILTDIEGTTSSISFVHEVLFPYSQKHLTKFIDENLNTSQVQSALADVKKTILEENQSEIDDEEAVLTLLDWIIKDRKHKALKDLQGLIWENGYKNGDFKGHVYSDVKPAFAKWKSQGLKMGVYSSGSVPAQKLLFAHSEAGDLTSYFSDYFDTAIGGKREISSYNNIKKALKIQGTDILFLSDIKEELDAAKMAGMKTVQLDRLKKLSKQGHEIVTTFSQIVF